MVDRRLKKQANCSSKYIGVCYHVKAKKFYAQIYHNKKVRYLGSFENELDARDCFRDYIYEHGLEHLYGPDVETY